MGGMPVNELDLPLGASATLTEEGLWKVEVFTSASEALAGLQFALTWPEEAELVDWALAGAEMRTNADRHAAGVFPFQFAAADGAAVNFPAGEAFATLWLDAPSLDGLALTGAVPGEACAGDLSVSRPVLEAVAVVEVAELADQTPIAVYPNPVSGPFTIQGPQGVTDLVLLDAAGRRVDVQWRAAGPGRWSVEALPASGFYVVRLVAGGAISSTRIVVTQ